MPNPPIPKPPKPPPTEAHTRGHGGYKGYQALSPKKRNLAIVFVGIETSWHIWRTRL
ncbi:hypothetical protein HBZS_103900 [Helicobacter bizzozeronii CCUG 35545]|nr:hypothetical protein HBZS_103900 [Helicobacter bizzozeronii CCUG 35545]